MADISKGNDIQMQGLLDGIITVKAMIEVDIGPRASVNTALQQVFTIGYIAVLYLIEYFPSIPHTSNDVWMLS